MLSIKSNTKSNPKRAKFQNQTENYSLTESSYNQKHFADLGKITEKLNNFDPTIRSQKSETIFSPYSNMANKKQQNYGASNRGNNFGSNNKEHHEDVYLAEKSEVYTNLCQKPNFNATYQPNGYHYTNERCSYETPQQKEMMNRHYTEGQS